MKIAILGGSFNPIHHGHLALAESVRLEFGYDKIIFVPTFISPFKLNEQIISCKHRLIMLFLAIQGNSAFEVEDCEIKREGVSFTIDTIEYLENKYGDDLSSKIGLIIGSDLVEGFRDWKDADIIAQKADIIIANRPVDKCVDDLILDFPFFYKKLENLEVKIASSEIRNAVLEKKSFRYLVPEAVYKYIKSNSIYE